MLSACAILQNAAFAVCPPTLCLPASSVLSAHAFPERNPRMRISCGLLSAALRVPYLCCS
eukprot:835367-Rhodomonas_salina.2